MKKSKKILNFVLLLSFTIIVMYFMLKDDFNATINQILSINLFWLFVAIVFLVLYWVINSVILFKIIKRYNPNYKYKKSLRLQIITQFFNAVTPFSTGGQPFEIYMLKKDGFTFSESTTIIMQQFILYQTALVSAGALAVLYNWTFDIFPKNEILKGFVLLGFLINAFVLITLFVLAYWKKLDHFVIKVGINILSALHLVKNKQEKIEKWKERIEEFNKGSKLLTKNKKEFFYLLFLSFLELVVLYLIPCFVLYGMGDYTSVSLINAFVASAYVMLIGSFVPIPGGTGGIEYGFAQFFGYFIKGPVLSAVLIVWRFVTYYFGLIVGSILVNVKGKD